MDQRLTIDNDTLFREIGILLSEGRRVKLMAKGCSMRPFIRDGDILVIVPATAVRKGDVALARVEGGGYVVHRIIGLSDARVILMGDGNLYGKEHCGRKDVLGTVTGIIRDGCERSLITRKARLQASFRRWLLPLRLLRHRMMNMIKRLTDE